MNLPAYLKSLGYVELPLRKTEVGQIEVQVRVNGRDALLLVDTGASGTVFDETSAARLNIQFKNGGAMAAGLGTSGTIVSACKLEGLEIGPLRLEPFDVRIIDMSHVNTALKQRGGTPCDGVLGADVLIKRDAVIDYKCFKLYLKGD